jgi:hypothetical protein
VFLKDSNHGKSRTKSPTPNASSSSSHSTPSYTSSGNTLFTSERNNMDYFTHAGVCKRTGTTEDELAVFAMKENIDNGLDFSEVNLPISRSGNPEMFIDIKYEKERKHLVIKIRNSNFGLNDIGFTENVFIQYLMILINLILVKEICLSLVEVYKVML